MLGLLESLEQNGFTSQRKLASELGIAVGLTNVYIKRCINKGLIKTNQAPARRYAYYVTPEGFVEKARLTVEYLSDSFGFFRSAKSDCSRLLQVAQRQGIRSVALAGRSDLAEIAALCATDTSVRVVGVLEPRPPHGCFVGLPLYPDIDSMPKSLDAIVLTDIVEPQQTKEALLRKFRHDQVLIPNMLLASLRQSNNQATEGLME